MSTSTESAALQSADVLTDGNAPVPFHLSLNVADLGRSVDFFRRLFAVEPAKTRSDYAKFELAAPALVLSLEPNEASAGARLNHLGIRLPNSAQLVELQRRLELAGISCQREEGVECCYSRQTKFWVTDPDGNLWEIYTLEEDLNHRGIGQLAVVERPRQECARPAAPAVWVHRLGDRIAERLPIETAGVDQVLLQGSFNLPLAPEQRQQLLAEVRRILKPAGQVTVHGLSAERSIADVRARLPGPAAAVEFIPAASDVIAELEAAGFLGIHFSKLDDAACFTLNNIGLQETRIVGFNPPPSAPANHAILYKGPFRELRDDLGRTFRRGEWILLDEPSWQQLQSSPATSQFLFRAVCHVSGKTLAAGKHDKRTPVVRSVLSLFRRSPIEP